MKVNQNTFNLLLNEDHTKFFKHIKKNLEVFGLN